MKHEMVEKIKKVFYTGIKAICNRRTGTAGRMTLLKKKFICPVTLLFEK